MYKDALHEGFGIATFLRSIAIGAIVAIAIQATLHFPLPSPESLILLFGLAYGAERGIVEIWKTFVRDEDQSKYFIPMQFSVRGVPVASAGARLAAGAVSVAVLTLSLAVVANLDDGVATLSHVTRAGLAGLVLGVLAAAGGSWKDAPKEGFEIVKFFRSPILTVLFACLMAQFTHNYLLIAVAAIGYERATAETYKTFFFPGKTRGKFSGKPVLYPEMLRQRKYFVPVYAAICVSVIACAAVAL
ncbi:MAG: hypothetical protein ABIR58_09520 [Gemmatimonadaceae bacterium]